MTFYAGTIGQLLIIEAFVFAIWLKVMFDAVRVKDGTLGHKKLLMTSIGLVLSSLAVFGIMATRIYELESFAKPIASTAGTTWLITMFYIMLGVGGFLFIISATLGNSTRLIKAFFIVSTLWLVFYFFRVNS